MLGAMRLLSVGPGNRKAGQPQRALLLEWLGRDDLSPLRAAEAQLCGLRLVRRRALRGSNHHNSARFNQNSVLPLGFRVRGFEVTPEAL
jgi:hypothetical protein